ncbi:MAG TPA: thiol-disulfide oxidoreductase [Anaerolineae bacterium]|nr:thiol-disulfide oxidoreductase [Anaerolineae bacterium]
MEKVGIPTVTVATSEFLGLSRSTMESIGLADMAFVEVPHPMGMIPLDEIRAKADAAFPEIVKAATQWKPEKTTIEGLGESPYPAKRIKFTGSYADLNKMFFEKGWSLGLPIIPPTPEAVEEMLKGTTHKPDEVVWVVPPRMGQLTVELVATLGVMAGCKPEHMPLMLAIVKGFSDENMGWRGTTTTTAATEPMVIINGPIVKELGIGYGQGCMGAEQPVNAALGYFVNLVGDIVGGSVPPEPDKSTQGSPADYVAMVLGENEDANPWKQSYAVEQGFKPTDNVVTVFTAYPGTGNIDHNSVKGTEILNTMVAGISGTASGISRCLTGPSTGGTGVGWLFMLVAPEHAATMFSEFKTKQEVQQYVVDNTKLPFKGYAPGLCKPPESFGPVTPDTLVPRFTDPTQIRIVVTGGAGKQSQLWGAFPQVVKPVSVLVEN